MWPNAFLNLHGTSNAEWITFICFRVQTALDSGISKYILYNCAVAFGLHILLSVLWKLVDSKLSYVVSRGHVARLHQWQVSMSSRSWCTQFWNLGHVRKQSGFHHFFFFCGHLWVWIPHPLNVQFFWCGDGERVEIVHIFPETVATLTPPKTSKSSSYGALLKFFHEKLLHQTAD